MVALRKHHQRQSYPYRRRNRVSVRSILTGLLLASAAGVGFTSNGASLSGDGFRAMLPGSGCQIKGNVSIDTGERIYHVPGQRYYDDTRISPDHGERWFCSEAEARKAGWRKSRV